MALHHLLTAPEVSDGIRASIPGVEKIYYLGWDFEAFLSLRDKIPEMIPCGEFIEKSAGELLPHLMTLDDMRHPDCDLLTWHVSDIAERSPYAGHLVLRTAQITAFRGLAETNAPALFIVDDVLQLAALTEAASQHGISISLSKKRGSPERLTKQIYSDRQRTRRFTAAIEGAKELVRSWQRSRSIRRMRRLRPAPLQELRNAEILILAWARGNTFDKTLELSSAPLMGEAPAILRRDQRKVAYLVLPLHDLAAGDEIFANATEAKDPVIISDELLRIRDLFIEYLSFILSAVRTKTPKSPQERDIALALKWEQLATPGNRRALRARFFHHFGKRLSDLGIRPKVFLQIYENHCWEKSFWLGLRESQANAVIIGLQQSPIATFYLNFLPSTAQLASAVFPDHLLTVSDRFREELLRCGLPEQRSKVVGGLRYDDIAKRRYSTDRPAAKLDRLVCALPIDFDGCLELAIKACEGAHNVGLPIQLNFHPLTHDTIRKRVIGMVNDAFPEASISFFLDPITELLGPNSILLYSDTNSVFEAALHGVPSIFVRRTLRISLNKMADSHCPSCLTGKDIATAVRRYMPVEARMSLISRQQHLASLNIAAQQPEVLTAVARSKSPEHATLRQA